MNIRRNKHSQNFPAVRVRSRYEVLVHAMFFLFALLAAGTGVSQADGLFDFQMKLANKGNVEAQFKVGEMYEKGFGVKKDTEEGLKWITKAAEHGHETASFKLLYYDIRKNGINDANRSAFDELNDKALAGNGQAQYYLGLMYANGVGVKRDEADAMDWLNKASLVGVTAAEAEIIKLRESQQQTQMRNRREAEKRKAREEAKRQEEARKRLEAKRLAEEAQKKKQAEIRAHAEKARAKAVEKKSREQEERERERELEKAKREAEEREKEQRRQALLEERKKKEQKKQEQFESDPCSGKSARFLSTCR